MKPTTFVAAALFLASGTSSFASPRPRVVPISNGSVTAPKIAPGAVIESKIATNAVTNSKINNGAVTESKIANGAVTLSKLGFAIDLTDPWIENGNNISFTGGQVLINTTTASSVQPPLVVRAAASNHYMRFDNANGTPGWEFLSDDLGFDISEANVSSGRLHIRPGGNIGIGTQNPASRLHVIGEARATVFTPTSDRNAKQDFTPVDSREVLAKVVALPITEWQYKTIQDARHMGPVAQDFRKAFGLGSDDKGISTVDADGVALAAIQGLNELVEEKDAEITRLEERLAQLEEKLNELVK